MQIGKSKSPLRTEIIQAMQSWEQVRMAHLEGSGVASRDKAKR